MRASRDVGTARAFVLGGNNSTLAFISSLSSESTTVTAHLVPIAQTPLGAVCAESWQKVSVALEGLIDWIDSTFPADDEHAFVAPVRDIELLARINWHVDPPAQLDEESLLNAEDVPDDIAQALLTPPARLIQCASCRRLCVYDDFVWKDRQLCAWDYHRRVFGKRGPWQTGPYEERHFESIPYAAYVAPALLEEAGAEAILAIGALDRQTVRATIELVMADASRPHMAVRTLDGYTVLREK